VQTSYHFDYGTTTGYGQITSTQTVDDTAPQVHVTTDVNGLTPGAEYHYRLVVADITGAWTTGADATFTTPAG
jgi:phosphodiesterase/alkaline phosphatase D-like protein